MDWEDLLVALFMFLVVVIPVFGFTARYALTPLIETLIRLREASVKQAAVSEEHLVQLTDELHRLTVAVERLEEAASFERRIGESALPPKFPHSGS